MPDSRRPPAPPCRVGMKSIIQDPRFYVPGHQDLVESDGRQDTARRPQVDFKTIPVPAAGLLSSAVAGSAASSAGRKYPVLPRTARLFAISIMDRGSSDAIHSSFSAWDFQPCMVSRFVAARGRAWCPLSCYISPHLVMAVAKPCIFRFKIIPRQLLRCCTSFTVIIQLFHLPVSRLHTGYQLLFWHFTCPPPAGFAMLPRTLVHAEFSGWPWSSFLTTPTRPARPWSAGPGCPCPPGWARMAVLPMEGPVFVGVGPMWAGSSNGCSLRTTSWWWLDRVGSSARSSP